MIWLLVNGGLVANGTPPTIDYQPQSQSVILYQQAIFGAIASGTPPFRYQWRRNGVPIPGATNDQIVIRRAQFVDEGLYSVIVSNAENTATSNPAALTVKLPVGGDVDCSFACGGSVNGGVGSVAVQPNGKVVIAGNFTTAHGAARGRIARLNADGTTDHTLMNGLSGISGYGWVTSVAVQSDGRVLIAGEFAAVDGVSRYCIARLNANGGVDTSFQDGLSGVSGWVNSVAVQSDGKVLIGGYFYKVNGVNRNSIARLNADGTLDTGFQNGLSGVTELPNNIAGTIHSVTVQGDGKILIGGVFYNVNGQRRGNIARLNADGSLDGGFLNGLSGADSWITSVAVQTDGKLLIGGLFKTVNGETRRGIARLSPDGTLDTGFQNGLSGIMGAWINDPAVYSVALQTNGKVVIGGRFNTVNGTPATNMARLNADGTLDNSFHEVLFDQYSQVNSVAVQTDGTLLIGGAFLTVNGENRHDIARLHSDGALDNGFQNPVSPALSGVAAVDLQTDGKLVIGGAFMAVNGTGRTNIARLNADGTLDSGFQNQLSGANGSVLCVALQPDGKALIGGEFVRVNGESRNGIARLNADGTLDSGFLDRLSGVHGSVSRIALQSDGKLLILGKFTTINDESRTNIARLNPDGALDSGFENGVSTADTDPDCPDGTVHSVALQSDGKVLIGGGFTSFNGLNRTNLVRLNPDGTLDSGFEVGFSGIGDSICPNPHGSVHSVVVQSDGGIIVGGNFNSVNGVNRNNIARLNADGSVDNGFDAAPLGLYGYVYSVAILSDGKLLIGGYFSTLNGDSRGGIAWLNRNGTLDSGFLNGLSGTDGWVDWVAAQSNGNVLIKGSFTAVNGVPTGNIAVLWGNRTSFIETLAGPASGSATLTLRLPPGSTNRVQYKTNLNDAVWIDLAGDVIASGSERTNKVDTTIGDAKQRFYRLRQVP